MGPLKMKFVELACNVKDGNSPRSALNKVSDLMMHKEDETAGCGEDENGQDKLEDQPHGPREEQESSVHQCISAPPSSTGSGCVGEAGDQMIGEHGGLFIPQGTLGWDASAPPASTGSGYVGEAGDQMTGEHG